MEGDLQESYFLRSFPRDPMLKSSLTKHLVGFHYPLGLFQ